MHPPLQCWILSRLGKGVAWQAGLRKATLVAVWAMVYSKGGKVSWL